MKDPDVQLVKFFHGIVVDEMKPDAAGVDHKECLKQVARWERGDRRDDFRGVTGSGPPTDHRSLRCARVFHRAPCLASAVSRHFAQLLRTHTFLLQRVVLRGTCRICCCVASAGPASEIVSVVRVLRDLVDGVYRSSDARPKRLDVRLVAVVGGESEWESVIAKMVDRLRSDAPSGPGRLDLRFVRAHLAQPLTDDVKEALGQSDFVTAVHLPSSLPESGDGLRTMKEIVPFLREGGTLLFLDSSGFQRFDALRDEMRTFRDVTEIYGPLTRDVHRMSFLCRRECVRLYSRYYGWRHCATESTHHVCAWYKRTADPLRRPASGLP